MSSKGTKEYLKMDIRGEELIMGSGMDLKELVEGFIGNLMFMDMQIFYSILIYRL